ncbi:muellerian-inhibiting factor [Rhinatrema bivittatum]|uniref:muellerian-inhibiting factor n=1 Tax=Rhinatrema bivittatum TaxID=194408 RepID=UPI00112677A0|nr:muellerian-inhibiting factor [Rhinatrema bivittatum]
MDEVRESRWDEGNPDTFGFCPGPDQPPSLLSLQRLGSYLADPQGKQLIVLHLQEVLWEKMKLKFKVTVEEDVAHLLEELVFSLLVFYPEIKEDILRKQRVKFVVTGEGIRPEQVVCLSPGTRYLVISTEGMTDQHFHQQLGFTVSFQIRHYHDGKLLEGAEVQQLLFGRNEKCSGWKMPVLFLFVKRSEKELGEVLPLSSPPLERDAESDTAFDPQPGIQEDIQTEGVRITSAVNESSPKSTAEFLESLSRFLNLVLSSCEDKPSTALPPLDLDSETLEKLPSHLLNISEKTALEWLVESEEPLVLLFPSGSKSVLRRQLVQQRLKGKLLEKMTDKLQALIDELREIPAFQDNAQLLMDLLDFCYGSFNVGFGPSVIIPSLRESHPQKRNSGHGKLHTLLLLKALQSLKEQWQEKRKVSRQNRSADGPVHCKLQELTLNFTSISITKNLVVLPIAYTLNNCEGPCRFPQSTRSHSTTHTILLIHMQESGLMIGRNPCCVPVRYSELQMLVYTEDGGLRIRFYPNMIATECGCR